MTVRYTPAELRAQAKKMMVLPSSSTDENFIFNVGLGSGMLGVAADRIAELEQLLNTPEVEDFIVGVRLEAAHQRKRWGAAHDRDKSAEHWFWLIGYLAGKANRAHIKGDREKALHHTISSAAALYHWHDAIRLDKTGAGIGRDADLEAHDT